MATKSDKIEPVFTPPARVEPERKDTSNTVVTDNSATDPNTSTQSVSIAGQPGRDCVVDPEEAGYGHMGRATPGSRVCSRHAMHYDTNGKRRGE